MHNTQELDSLFKGLVCPVLSCNSVYQEKLCLFAGGANAYWSGCNYPLFTAFLIMNGCAFVLSVAATVVVTAFPLVLSKTPHQAVLGVAYC